MAINWTFGVNDPQTVTLWSAEVDYDAANASAFGQLVYDSNPRNVGQVMKSTMLRNVVKRRNDLDGDKKRGSTIRVYNVAQLSKGGVYGDALISGTAENLQTFTQDVLIDQIRKTVRSDGKLSEKRVLMEFRPTAKSTLADWFSVFLDESCTVALVGENTFVNSYVNFSSGAFGSVMGNALQSTDGNHTIYAGNATSNATAANSGNSVTAQLLTLLSIEAEQTVDPPLRQIKMKDPDIKFLGLFDQNIKGQLAYDSDWRQAMEQAAPRSMKNEVLRGSIGNYGGIEIVTYNRAFRPITNVAYGLLLGADALNWASAQGIKWFETYEDNNNREVVQISAMFGLAPTYFNGSKRNMFLVPHYVKV